MEVRSNKDNLAPLRERCEALEEGEIRIASGWIRSEYLKKVLSEKVQERIRSGAIELYVLFRIGSPQDVKITDPGVLSLLDYLSQPDESRVEWRFSSHHHAKMYLVGEEWGMLGSFNLTGGGFGDEMRPGSNPEAGVVTTNKKELSQLRAHFDSMWNEAKKMEERLLGFVANPSTDSSFAMVGVEALPAGKFVEVPLGRDEFILAKVERSYRYNENFFFVQNEQMPDPELFRQLAGRRKLQNQSNGLAFAGDNADYQLNVAEVKPLNLIRRAEGEASYRFEPVNIPPAVASPVNSASQELLTEFFNPSASSFAVLEENPDVEVSFRDEEILNKHFAVLGSTGSGKSYFVKKYLQHRLSSLVKEKNLRVVIIDTHGEYSGTGEEEQGAQPAIKDIFEEAEEISKAEAVHLEDMEDIKEHFGTPNKREKEILREAFDRANRADSGSRRETFLSVLSERLEEEAEDAEPDWNHVLDQLKAAIEEEEKKPTNRPLAGKIWGHLRDDEDVGRISDQSLKDKLRGRLRNDIIEDLRKEFPRSETASTLLSNLKERIEANEFRLETLKLVDAIENPGIYRLNLHSIDDSDQRRSIVGDLLQESFEEAKRRGGDFQTLFIIDEAQNYAPEPASLKIPSYRWMKVIASEGRKFGVGLLVMTQRPQYLSKDILTQCNTQAIFRLVNKADLAQVENAVEGISEHDLTQLPNFVAGQAIFTGIGMQMPVRVRVKR